jgi:hypothetical protein
LVATKNNRGHIGIEQPDLDDWMSRRTERAASPVPEPAPQAVTRHEDAERIAGLEVRVEMLSVQVDDIKADRDRWREQAETLASHSQRGIIARIFRR